MGGRMLRFAHKENVTYLRERLFDAGIAAQHTPSHIIPIHIGDPEISTRLSNELIKKYGHYVQAINYPTVPKGEEKLRVAPTPHHTREMMDQFVLDLTSEWKALGLPLNPKLGACQPASCAYCRQPAEFARLAARECPLASTGRACPLGELATVAA